MSVFLCGVCAARVRGSSLAEFGEFGDSRADLPQFDSGVALCLGALTPRDCCMLCLNLFPFLQSSAAVELLRFAVSPFSQRRFVLSVALSASHMLRETLLCRQRTTSPSASEWAARFVRELLVGDNWTEGEGGVVVTLSDSNGPNDVLAVQDASAPAPQTNSGDKSSKRQKRARAANEQPQQLSRARLQQLLAHSSPAQLVSDILRRTQNQICPPLAAHPTFTAVGPDVFVGGRYTKFARNMPQSRWLAQGERIGHSSVEEEIAAKVLPLSGGSATLGAAGREDRNVRMVGPGRPFYLHIRNVSKVFSDADLAKIVFPSDGAVQVRDLAILTPEQVKAVNDGASAKTKSYRLLVRTDAPSASLSLPPNLVLPIVVKQKTPVRVLHRRGNLVRERDILALSTSVRDTNVMQIEMETSAGMYIKEWVHGDLGRTRPSLSDLLGSKCTFLSLDVYDVRLSETAAAKEEDDEEE